MLDASYLNDLNRILASLEDRIELSLAERLTYFRAVASADSLVLDERRGFARRQLRSRAVLELQQSLPGIQRERGFHCIYTHDVSRTGICFLHADELYPGEKCRLWLPHQALEAIVVRCHRKAGQCFEIGARFQSDQSRTGAA